MEDDAKFQGITSIINGASSRFVTIGSGIGKLGVAIGLIPFLLVFLFIVVGSLQPRFLATANLVNVARQSVYLTIVSVGGMLPILCAGLDLSVGSSIALTSVVCSLMTLEFGVVVGVFSGIVVAAAVGAFNGAVISIFRTPPFIVTLAMLSIAQGIALIVSKGAPILGLPKIFIYLDEGTLGAFPIPVVITLLVIFIMYLLLNWTRIGRYLYAIGGNEEAARVAGIPIKKYIFLAYLL